MRSLTRERILSNIRYSNFGKAPDKHFKSKASYSGKHTFTSLHFLFIIIANLKDVQIEKIRSFSYWAMHQNILGGLDSQALQQELLRDVTHAKNSDRSLRIFLHEQLAKDKHVRFREAISAHNFNAAGLHHAYGGYTHQKSRVKPQRGDGARNRGGGAAKRSDGGGGRKRGDGRGRLSRSSASCLRCDCEVDISYVGATD